MDIMLKWIAYVILSAAETWIGYRRGIIGWG